MSMLKVFLRGIKTYQIILSGLVISYFCLYSSNAYSIHSAPIIIKGKQIYSVARYPVSTYRVLSVNKRGVAKIIPFQIDELNKWGDYVLDQGVRPNTKSGNGIFDVHDELAIMGDNVGEDIEPKVFPGGRKPNVIYKLTFSQKEAKGAVFIAVYFSNPPPLSTTKYVNFDYARSNILTSRFRYHFDKKNHLVVRGVDKIDQSNPEEPKFHSILAHSVFYMKADLKYFITVSANHRTIDSELEAYKTGPIRVLVRVNFFYKFLSLKFELGMYTEVSFFSNTVVLPAVMYNPVDGPKRLNEGSGFYYGFAIHDNPKDLNLTTNMPNYEKKGFMNKFFSFGSIAKVLPKYWTSLHAKDKMMFFEVKQSEKLQQMKNYPQLYVNNKSSAQLKLSDVDKTLELGESPVNLGIFFDMTKFTEGEHKMAFKLYFENHYSEEKLKAFKRLDKWNMKLQKLQN